MLTQDQTFQFVEQTQPINVTGAIAVATGGIWSTSGTGTFSPSNTSLTMSYTASAADIANGGVVLTLTTTGNGSCIADVDSMNIQISNGITANAGLGSSGSALLLPMLF